MDLIYANENLVDQGILQDYSFDMEYGKGEKDTNTFACKIQKYNPAIRGENPIMQDFILYIEFTEYGGIVDRIVSDVKTGEITLSGRTWHGILNSFIIEPPIGSATRKYSGVLSSVLTQMISDVGISDFFVVDPEDEDDTEEDIIHINNFEVRYEPLYDAIIRMLDEKEAKFICYYYNGKVHITGVLVTNYAVVDEFDSSQVLFKVGKTYNNINHMVCLGQGNGEKRAVIHLFTDEDGGIQPYAKTDEPLQDSDYILDKSNQIMTGFNERAYLYDYPNADITYNYVPLSDEDKPDDWDRVYPNYFERKADDSNGNAVYSQLKRVFKDRFHLLTKEPSDWKIEEGYKNYYTCKVNEAGEPISGTPVKKLQENDPECVITYEPTGGKYGQFWNWTTDWKKYYEYNSVTQRYSKVSSDYDVTYDNPVTVPPNDWIIRYSSYNTRYWDGTQWQYEAVKGIPQAPIYEPHDSKPDNWNTNFGDYYTKAKKTKKDTKGKILIKKGSYIRVSQAMNEGWLKAKSKKAYPEWKKGKFYTKKDVPPAAPPFPGIVYMTIRTEKAPVWRDGLYYERIVNNTPKFKLPDPANDFYGYWELHKNEEQIPNFVAGNFYRELEDRYKVLINDALEKLAVLRDTSTLDIDLELEANYDVGDIVGSIDEVTKIEVNKPILRKIVKIKKDILTISYEVE